MPPDNQNNFSLPQKPLASVPPMPPAVEPPQTAKTLTTLLVILVLVIVAAIIFWGSDSEVVPTSEPIPEEVENVVADGVDFMGPQTYRNEEYGFEFKYPVGWQVEEQLGEGSESDTLSVNLTVPQATYNLSAPAEIKIRVAPGSRLGYDDRPTPFITVDVDGVGFLQFLDDYHVPGQETLGYEGERDFGVYSLSVSYRSALATSEKDVLVNLLDQIVSTFKFINSGLVDTSNWQTYRNEEDGFEFKYPEDWEIEIVGDAVWLELYPKNRTDLSNRITLDILVDNIGANQRPNIYPDSPYVGSGNKTYYIQGTPTMLRDQIFSTFKFTNQE